MDLSKLSYKKDESKQEPETPIRPRVNEGHTDAENISTEVEDDETNHFIIPSNVSPEYQKGDSFRVPSLIFIISGGEKREKDFLKELIKGNKSSILKALFLSKKRQGLNPSQMQEIWKNTREKGEIIIDNQSYRLDEIDDVFLLTDVDEFYKQLRDILSSKSKDDNGRWIISNPCFEIWLYYCYKNTPKTDLDCITTSSTDKRSQKLKRCCNEVVKGGLNGKYAFNHMDEGIKNSLEHYNEDNNGIPVLFATQMHEMAQFIKDKLK